MAIKAGTLDLIEEVFANGNRQYQVPIYQRNYDWQKDNCLELFNDVILAYENDKVHFLGTFVWVLQGEKDSTYIHIIIDGQQRITSIYLLLKAMYDECENDSIKKKLEELIFNKTNKSESKDFEKNDKNKLKLKLNESDNKQFLYLMSDEIDKMEKDANNIYRNYQYFKKLIEEKIKNNEEDIIKNIMKGLEKLVIVRISINKDDDPQTIFERINSTGEDLQLSDLIRNYLLMTDENMELLYEKYWLPMESSIGRNNINDYFINYISFRLPKSTEKNAYRQFKKYSKENNEGFDSHEDILKDLEKYSKYYNAFIGNSNKYSKDINYYLKVYRDLKQTTIFPFLFSIFSDLDEGKIDEDQVCDILKLFLNYTIRRIICGVPSNSLRDLYKTLYKRIFNEESKKNRYIESIYDFMSSIPMSIKDSVPNDMEFKHKLMNENIYKNKSSCKYILAILENGFPNRKEAVNINSEITIEHIMPQNIEKIREWQEMLGDDWQDVHEKYLHTIGNLTLTGHNSEMSNKSFEEKKKTLDGKFKTLNSDIIDQEKWNEDTINGRSERLSNELIECLKLPFDLRAEKSRIEQNYTLEDSVDLTGTKPIEFAFENKIQRVSAYSELFKQTVEILYEKYERELLEMAKNNITLPNGNKPFISYDQKVLGSPKEIKDSGIYIDTRHDSNRTIKILRLFFEKLEIEYDSFEFTIIRDEIDISNDAASDDSTEQSLF